MCLKRIEALENMGSKSKTATIHSEVNDRELVLVPGRKSRGSGNWDKDDYDVRLGDASGPVVGRIMRHP